MIGVINTTESDPIPSLERLCLILRKWFKIDVLPQSLLERINRKETALFIKEITLEVLKYEVNKSLVKCLKNRRFGIDLFSRILLQDSTVVSLPETLWRMFRGCGGAASKAAVKYDFIIDQCSHVIVRVKFTAGKNPDATMSGEIINYLEEGDLVIRDLGYFNLSQLSKINNKNAYFISRLSISANVYLNKEDKNPIDLIEHLKKLNINDKNVDIDVYIGQKERLLVRLVAIKVPPEVIEARRKRQKETKAKKEPSEALHEWNGFTIMITNIPKIKLSVKMILIIYKIRWQIELFFKNMKSQLSVDGITGKNKYRILCIIYLKIVLTWMVTILYAYAQNLIVDKEVSLFKFTKWLKEDERLKKACISGDFFDLLKELERDIDLLCKQKRTKKTTAEDIEMTYETEKYTKAA